jgi:hypothetical protein
MKQIRYAVPLLLLCLAGAGTATPNAQTAFAAMKSLTGTWTGKAPDGRVVDVSFRLTANGSALMSEIGGGEDMITMFHLDGNRLLMTHYCGAGNQPRMVGTASDDGKTITFEFLDVTNLASPQAGHMHRLVISMPDTNHHTETWTYLAGGKEMTETFSLTRKQ